jgi:RimJ/RimL family protein N-acetyltransferase
MMLRRAFACGIRRVEFRVDARNGRSLAAMKKLGAVEEGVLRSDRITWTGHVRDTVLFSILKEEWEAERKQDR